MQQTTTETRPETATEVEGFLLRGVRALERIAEATERRAAAAEVLSARPRWEDRFHPDPEEELRRRALVLDSIRNGGHMTRDLIAVRTGLTLAVAARIVGRLVREGEVVDVGSKRLHLYTLNDGTAPVQEAAF